MKKLESARLGDSHAALSDLVHDALRREIIEGRRRPGDRLVEQELARAFGVSRNPARDALRRLSAEGFVTLLPRRGAAVAEVTPAEALQLFEVREALEVAAAGLAARHRVPSWLERIAELVSEEIEESTSSSTFGAVNGEFHDAVAQASGNRYLIELLQPLRWKVQWVFQRSAPQRVDASLAEHRRLANAIIDGDESEAREAAKHHVMQARDAYLELTAITQGKIEKAAV